jgi:predicted nucleic-acid-binding Zn-ribbon protein
MRIFRKATPRLVTVFDRPLLCLVCGAGEFWDREVKLNSSAMEFLDLGWANQSALGLICARCGYVHEFVGDTVSLWDRDHGYPAE